MYHCDFAEQKHLREKELKIRALLLHVVL